jgi:hypothetical protein
MLASNCFCQWGGLVCTEVLGETIECPCCVASLFSSFQIVSQLLMYVSGLLVSKSLWFPK